MKITYLLSVLLLAVTISFTSCKPEMSPAFKMAKAAYEKEDNAANAKAYIENIRKAVVNGEGDKKALLETGLEIAEKYKMGPTAVSFFMPLIKDYQDTNTPDHIAKLASALKDLGRDNAAEIMTQSYLSQAPNGKFAELLKTKVGSDLKTPSDRLKEMAEAVFVEPDKYGINRKSAQRYVDACEAYALGFPKANDAPTYLYRGAEMARTLKTYNKALAIYDWIAEKYPNYEKTPTTLFLKGFMLENELADKPKAKEVYQSFLKLYPNHELTDDINFLLENIDKSDKEIMEMIEQKKQ